MKKQLARVFAASLICSLMLMSGAAVAQGGPALDQKALARITKKFGTNW